MDRDRNLLFGILAVQLRKVTPGQLVDVAAMWATDPSRPLAQRLVEQKILSDKDRQFIDDVVQRAIEEHGGNPGATLASMGGEAQVNATFCGSIVCTSDDGVSTRESSPLDRAELDLLPAGLESPGRYSHMGEFGRGGMGRVLLVHDTHIGRDIAMKELLPNLSGSGAATPVRRTVPFIARFLQEARITGRLEHPSIVPVYELGRNQDGQLYYTMKLVRGKTLYDAIHEKKDTAGRLELLPHFVDLCHAIAYAHSRGVVHRDIKPANIMVGEFGETVVLDWGLAKALGREDKHEAALRETILALSDPGESKDDGIKTQYGQALGTPVYMPPEQAQGHLDQIDERSDVYGLGAVLYELLTGKTPFSGMGSMQVLRAVIEDEPAPITKAAEGVPPELAAICERAMRKNPAKRYPSAKELAADVQRFQSGALVQAHTYSPTQILRRYARQHRAALSSAAAALAVIFALTVFGFLRITQERNAALSAKNDADQQRNVADEQRKTAEQEKAKAEEAKAIAEKEKIHAEGEKARAEEASYRNTLMLAANWLTKNRPDQVIQLLNETPEGLRNWEWGHLKWRAVSIDKGDLLCSSKLAIAGSSPDFNRFLATDNKSYFVCDTATGEHVQKLEVPEGVKLDRPFFSETGKYIVGEAGRMAYLFAPDTGKLLRKFASDYNEHNFTADDSQMLLNDVRNEQYTVVDPSTGDSVYTTTRQDFSDPVLKIGGDTRLPLPNIMLLSAQSSNGIQWSAFDIRNGNKELGRLIATSRISALSPNGQLLAAELSGGGLSLAQLPMLDNVRAFERAPHDLAKIAFSRRGDLIAGVGRNGQIHIWRTDTLACLGSVQVKASGIEAILIDSDYVFVNYKHSEGLDEVWNWRTGLLVARVEAYYTQLLDGELRFTLDSQLRRINLKERKAPFNDASIPVLWSSYDEAENTLLSLENGGWSNYDFPAGTFRSSVRIPGLQVRNAVKCTPDSMVFTRPNIPGALSWSNKTPGRVRVIPDIQGEVFSFAKDPKGKTFIATTYVGEWDTNHVGSLILRGKHLGGTLFDTATMKILREYKNATAGWTAYSADARRIAVRHPDGLHICDTETGEDFAVIDGLAGVPSFSPSAAYMTSRIGHFLSLYDLSKRERVWTFTAGNDVLCSAITPDEKRIAVAIRDEGISVLEFLTGKLVASIPAAMPYTHSWDLLDRGSAMFFEGGEELWCFRTNELPESYPAINWRRSGTAMGATDTTAPRTAAPSAPSVEASKPARRFVILNPTQLRCLADYLKDFGAYRNNAPTPRLDSTMKPEEHRAHLLALGLGMAPGDRITAINDANVGNDADWSKAMSTLQDNPVQTITLTRREEKITLEIISLEMEVIDTQIELPLAPLRLVPLEPVIRMLEVAAPGEDQGWAREAEKEWMLPDGYKMYGTQHRIRFDLALASSDPMDVMLATVAKKFFESAHLQKGDWLRAVNGKPIKEMQVLVDFAKDQMAALKKGEPFTVDFEVHRNLYQIVNIHAHFK